MQVEQKFPITCSAAGWAAPCETIAAENRIKPTMAPVSSRTKVLGICFMVPPCLLTPRSWWGADPAILATEPAHPRYGPGHTVDMRFLDHERCDLRRFSPRVVIEPLSHATAGANDR